MLNKLSLKTLLAELIIALLAGLSAGLATGQAGWSVAGTLLVLIGWHFRQLLRLSHWLWVDRSMTPPAGHGSWQPLFQGLYLMQQRNRRWRSELPTLIQRFRSGAESLPDALVLMTGEGNIFWCNGLAQRCLGLRWPDDNGQNIQNLLRYPDFSRYLQQQVFDEPLVLPLNNGQRMELRIMAYAEDQWLIVARNVSQIHQLENMRRHFFANASHELRTPLTVLQGYLEMMAQGGLLPSQQAKALATMETQTRRMSVLVRQLLTLSRIEAAPLVSVFHPVNLPEMLSMVGQEAETLSGSRHFLQFNIDQSLQTCGDEDQMRSAVSNLVFNAIHHTPPGTKITVSWHWHPQGAEFSVTDNGPGISAVHLPRLAERFYRVDQARSRHTGGSGLGLAIAKHALNHHGSRLQISSEPCQLTRFSFILPAASASQHEISSIAIDRK